MHGEMERIWLATANSELRSEVLALKQALSGWDAVFEMTPKRDSDLGRLKHDIVADEIVRLRNEVERLRAAGDALADSVDVALHDYSIDIYDTLPAWREARRG